MNINRTGAAFLFGLLLSPLVSADYSRDTPMTVARLNGIDIAYQVVGDAQAPPVLMVMGLSGSHRLWGEDIVNGLTAAGYRVVLFDNRDTGQSARLDELGTPTIWWEMIKNMIGLDVDAPYSLDDMAEDGISVLDELGIERAHIVGASMGGMIAQIIAAEHAPRALTLVSIMSTTGAPHLPEAEEQAAEGLLDIAGSEGDATARMHEIGIYPEAMPRQLMAIISAGDRSAQVQTITVPTLVVHGADDTLLPPPHGEHTHEMIRGSTYVVFEGMGHNLPEPVVPDVVAAMVNHFQAAQ
jgi:pimeloyl-ACP methyl ester carboxylesterase